MRHSRRALIALLFGVTILAVVLAHGPRTVAGPGDGTAAERRASGDSARRRAEWVRTRRDAKQSGAQARARAGRAGAVAGMARGRARGEPLSPVAEGSPPAAARRESFATWPHLDALSLAPGKVSVGVTGRDPLAPRELRLWHIEAGRPLPLARTRSTADGRFDFGQLPSPNRGLRLIVTPLGLDPRSPTPLELRTATPPPPLIAMEPSEDGGVEVHFLPALQTGELILLDGQGDTLQRIGLGGRRRPGDSGPFTTLQPLAAGQVIFVVHELPDGRRSAARAIARATPSPAT